ncbi:hypothetical protein UFOVP128_23 [uncultured Caudovirales phage]|uniref:Uncharacterized protein n=1 Tax=uncultured Caudovirales phage TaxID=2100421 RepID=A0A6J5L7T4_9CAUD|nr:hypothetical protein UFOVP128_23 [uncultured Caudovirales phage]CAB5222052.1 hypothetical protein UFOVP243_21 [uncultured Caudovirales phage]
MPLTILAGMNAAVAAIQQGCELYKEYKGVVLKAKETFDEAKGQVEEVIGVWNFIKSKLFPKESPPAPTLPDVKKSETSSAPRGAPAKEEPLDEQRIKKELVKNLKIFFKGMIAIDKKIKVQQERIDTQEIPADELLDVSLDHVLAKKEMEKLQTVIRETMVYQSPAELGALYTDVIEMFGLVQEKQEVTHLLNIRKRKEAYQRQQQLLNKIRQRILWVIVMALVVMEIWGLTLAILLARPRL